MKASIRPAVVLPLVGLLLVGSWAGPARIAAQESVLELADECGSGDPELRSWCREVALALQAAQGGVGFLSAGGDELPGSASTVGWRLGSVPRVTVAGRLQLGRLHLPGLREGARTPTVDRTSTVSAFHLNGAVGVYDGLSPMPTVGGILAVDLLGSAGVVLLPDSEGFDEAATSYGIGARVGVLRESFTLPGVTLSAVQRWTGRVRLGSLDDGDAGEADFDLSTTSIRATAGKDLLGVGLLAGVGWDRYASDVRIAARDARVAGAPPLLGEAAADGFSTSRTVVYGGASLNFLVLQLSAEGGWAAGYDPVAGRSDGGFDPEGGTPFGSVALRLIF